KVASLADASVSTLSTEAPSLADSVGLHTLKVAQTTTTEPTSQQKTVPVDDLLKSSSLHASDPVSKLLSSTALKTAQTPEQNDVNTSIDQTTNLDHLLPNTTSSPLQNILEQTYPVV
ncbi:Ig-like domain repeat protein, partial [Acinetobacter baumannii]